MPLWGCQSSLTFRRLLEQMNNYILLSNRLRFTLLKFLEKRLFGPIDVIRHRLLHSLYIHSLASP